MLKASRSGDVSDFVGRGDESQLVDLNGVVKWDRKGILF